MINTAGGITGGDRFSVSAHAQAETQLTLTTQACERAYCAQAGQEGQLRTHLRVDDGAQINWLPQETLLFSGANLNRKLQIDLADHARLLMVESLIFGRLAMGEQLTQAVLNDRIEIRRNGLPHYLDVMQLGPDVEAQLARAFAAGGAGAMATVVFVAPNADALLQPVRDLLPDQGGASLLCPDTLVLRALATDGFDLRQSLIPILRRLKGGPLPRCWMT